MDTLFGPAAILPPGFTYLPDFIDRDEESEICRSIADVPLHPLKFQGFEAKRKVASFGYDYHFDTRKLTKGAPVPDMFFSLTEKVTDHLHIPSSSIAELVITEYPPGSVINWHRDGPPFGIIIGISLLSDCIFRLRPHDKDKQSRSSVISFPVARRSLYIMEGEARESWQHSIAPVRAKRYSITLRTLKDPNY